MPLLHRPMRRRAATACAVAVLAAALSTVLVPLDARPSTAETPLDAPVREGPFVQELGAEAHAQFTLTYGEDARCGPQATGDGWECTTAARPNGIEVASRVPSNTGGHRLQLFLPKGGNPPQASDLRQELFYGTCNCAFQRVMAWIGNEGGTPWVRVTYTSGGMLRDTGFVRLAAASCRCGFPTVRAASEIENVAPSSSVYSPSAGTVIHRSQPEHLQEFAATFADIEHHNIETQFVITAPNGNEVRYAGFAKAAPRNGTTGAYPLPVSTPPLQLPHLNGTYTIQVGATDTSGRPTAAGAASPVSTFEYVWNLPPRMPDQVVPAPDAVLPPNVPVAFVAKAVDPENDALTMKTVIDGTKTYHSIPTASGREAVTIIHDGIRTGNNRSAVVSGIDLNREEGDGNTVVFSVAEDIALPSNQPPATPAQVSPVDGGTFAAGAPQDFVVRTTDPEGDAYRAVIDVATIEGHKIATFATDEAPSGQAVSARPLTVLPPGSYRWMARAFDSKGALGYSSPWLMFSVAAPPATVVSDDCATGTTVSQVAAAGHYGHLQALGNELCWRIDGPAAASGGKVTVSVPGGSAPPVASVDEDTASCGTVLLAGGVGDPADPPTHLPFRVATRVSEGEASVCIDIGAQRRRLRQQFPGVTTVPTVTIGLDPPGRRTAPLDPTPGLPSSSCSGHATSTAHAAMLTGPVFAHVTSWRETPTRVHLCTRMAWSAGVGGPTVGGRFTVDTTASPGSSVTLDVDDEVAACNLRVAWLAAPVVAELRRSSGTNPASVCVLLQGLPLRIGAGATGTPTPPTVTWTPDPGTPGLP